MQDCNSVATPTVGTKPLGSDPNGASAKERWSYASIVGMLLYVAANSRPDISFAVHQCARFTHSPKASHEAATYALCDISKAHVTKD